MQHAYIVGFAHLPAGYLHLLKGDWPKAYPLIEHARVVLHAANVVLQLANVVLLSAWVLAQSGETSEALNRIPRASCASSISLRRETLCSFLRSKVHDYEEEEVGPVGLDLIPHDCRSSSVPAGWRRAACERSGPSVTVMTV